VVRTVYWAFGENNFRFNSTAILIFTFSPPVQNWILLQFINKARMLLSRIRKVVHSSTAQNTSVILILFLLRIKYKSNAILVIGREGP
jgi:hypothetical protein